MLNNSEIALPRADVPGEEFLPLFTQLDPISKGPVNLKYPTYPTPFSTVLLGNSPQSSNAKPKKKSFAPTRDEVGEFRFNQFCQCRRIFAENKERLNLNTPKTPTHIQIVVTSRKQLPHPANIAKLLPVLRKIRLHHSLLLRRFANLRPNQDVSYEGGTKRHHEPLYSPHNCFSERSKYNRHRPIV